MKIELSDRESIILNYFLEDYDDYLSRKGCNDLPEELKSLFSSEEGKSFEKPFALWNTRGRNDWDGPNWPFPDHSLFAILKNKLKGNKINGIDI